MQVDATWLAVGFILGVVLVGLALLYVILSPLREFLAIVAALKGIRNAIEELGDAIGQILDGIKKVFSAFNIFGKIAKRLTRKTRKLKMRR